MLPSRLGFPAELAALLGRCTLCGGRALTPGRYALGRCPPGRAEAACRGAARMLGACEGAAPPCCLCAKAGCAASPINRASARPQMILNRVIYPPLLLLLLLLLLVILLIRFWRRLLVRRNFVQRIKFAQHVVIFQHVQILDHLKLLLLALRRPNQPRIVLLPARDPNP